MNRNTILGFAGGLVFAASLVIGLIVADATTDQGGGEARLPGALGDPIEIISGIPISDPDAPAEFEQPIEPTQAAYVPIAGARGGSGAPRSEAPEGEDLRTDGSGSTEFTLAPLAPVEADSLIGGFFTGDLFFDIPGFGPFRFLDLCADDGALPGCPFGVGGTVLAPFDHGGLHTLGDFRLGAAIRSVFDVRNDCGDHYPAAEDEHPLFVWANHPAAFEITYHSTIRRDLTTTVTVSNTDSDHPELLRFAEDAAEGRLATSAWPRECFLLTQIHLPISGAVPGDYIVEINATSITGETASKTYAFNTAT